MENENPSGDVITETVPAQEQVQSTDSVTVDTQVSESVAAPATQTTEVSDVDESGVPFKNRYFEMQRKYEDITKSIPTMIQEAVQAANKSQQPQYTVSDYQAAMMKDPGNSPYYQSKIMELQKAEIEQTVTQKLSEFEQGRNRKQTEAQAFQWATTTFPQLQNPNDPLSVMTWNLFNQRPAEKREPSDFAIAAELAAARLGVRPAGIRQANQVQEKLVQKERELKKLVKQTALEGNGRPSTAPAPDAQRRADLQEALSSGKTVDYLKKYFVVQRNEE